MEKEDGVVKKVGCSRQVREEEKKTEVGDTERVG
jgi:hypothetical protein